MLQAVANVPITKLWERLIVPHPSITDIEQRRQSRLLATIAGSFSLLLAVVCIRELLIIASGSPTGSWVVVSVTAVNSVLETCAFILNHKGRYRLAARLFVGALLISVMAYGAVDNEGLFFVTLVILLAAIFFTMRDTLIIGGAIVIIEILLALFHPISTSTHTSTGLFMGLFSVVLIGAFTQHRIKIEQERRLELQRVNDQLRESEASLEKRVAARTRELQVAADVSRQITTILDLNELLQAIVERTKSGFNLYHTSIFLYDPEASNIVFAAGAGYVGEQMKSKRWAFHVPTASGMVSEAARTRAAVVINDVRVDKRHAPNPLLPETQAELSLPMTMGDTLIGVLDFQSEQANRFSEDDIRVMTSLAEQIAIAVNNARLYAEQLQVAEQLRQIDNLKSSFLASMSHELRTPLNAILNFTKFVASGMMGPVNEKQVDALTKTIDSGRHLLSLINDVLDISKIEAKMLTLFIETDVNLSEELNTVIAAGETLLAGKPVKLVQDIDPNLPMMVGDKRRIRQIILNLVSNACKFTETGSVTIGAQVQGDRVQLYVRDTGPGIAPEDQELIFEAFRQTRTGLGQGGGTGLGLAIAKRLAEAHGGQLWLESTPGQGATFYVSLPIRSEALQPLEPAAAGA